MSKQLQEDARAIFAEALRQVDVRFAVQRHIHCDANTLLLANAQIALGELYRIVVIAVGKAAPPMFRAEYALRPSGLPLKGVIVGPEPTSNLPAHTAFLPGSHPTPDERSLLAADAVLDLLATTNGRTAVLFVVSGGASAMLERALDPSLSLAEVGRFHRALVASGLPIDQMNVLRKHFSAVKGGRLACAAAAARVQCTLLPSDVPSGALDSIGSGPSLPDMSTLADCAGLVAELGASLSPAVSAFFANPLCTETPKPGDVAFAPAYWAAILSSEHLAEAAAAAPVRKGIPSRSKTPATSGSIARPDATCWIAAQPWREIMARVAWCRSER